MNQRPSSHPAALPSTLESPRTLSREGVRFVDQFAIEQLGYSGLVLMENAGRGTVDCLLNACPQGAVSIYCGVGNNAGDGFVVARHLTIRGVPCRVVLAVDAEKLKGDAKVNFDLARQVPEIEWCCLEGIDSKTSELPSRSLVDSVQPVRGEPVASIVDAMLGTGASGAPRAPLDGVIRFLNQVQTKRFALDIPSGLDCETGAAPGEVFSAHMTFTYAALKPGLLASQAASWVGELQCLDIGLPDSVLAQAEQTFQQRAAFKNGDANGT